MKTTSFIKKVVTLLAIQVTALLPLPMWGFQEVEFEGVPTGERGSYVARDGVSLNFEGHAALLTGVSGNEGATLVCEIRGLGDVVQLSKFYPGEAWGPAEVSFLRNNEFKGCGHPPYCDGLSPASNKAYRDQVYIQATRATGKPYVNPVFEILTLWKYGNELSSGETRITDGVPDIPGRFRCDGLMEWSYEAAQAVMTGMSGNQNVDSEWGVYKANEGIWATPRDLYDPPNNNNDAQTSKTIADFPNMKPHVAAPVVNGKTYSVTWTAPFDLSGIFKYAYGWVAVGVPISVLDPATMLSTPTTSVTNAAMPQGINAAGRYRFVVMAMDKLGHWSDAAGTYESPEINWNPTSAPPVIVSQPVSRTGNVGSSVTFQVSASGLAPLTY